MPVNATVPVAPVAPVVAAQAQPAALMPVTPNVKAAVALVQPQVQLPNPLLPAQTLAQYKNTLKRIVAFKRWKMAYYYIYSTRMSAYVSTMQEDDKLSEDMKKAKAFMAKAAIFFDILANYEITGFIYCVLLLTWAFASVQPKYHVEPEVFGKAEESEEARRVERVAVPGESSRRVRSEVVVHLVTFSATYPQHCGGKASCQVSHPPVRKWKDR